MMSMAIKFRKTTRTTRSKAMWLWCLFQILATDLMIAILMNTPSNTFASAAASSSPSSSPSTSSINDKNGAVQTECIPSTDDHSIFHCLNGAKSKLSCIDTNDDCPNWAKRGECSKNPQYMLIQCRKSCDSCLGLHTGVTQIAPDEKTRDEILRKLVVTQEYMFYEAERNIQALTKCINKHDLCTYWSVNGECTTNPTFMNMECSPACRTCHIVVP